MIVNLNHIKAVIPFADQKNNVEWLGYVHVNVTESRRIYEAMCPTHGARIIHNIASHPDDCGDVWIDPRSFKLPTRINIPVAVMHIDKEHRTFTIPQVNVMGQLMGVHTPSEDTIGHCFDRVYSNPVYGDMYVPIEPAILGTIQKFIGAGQTNKDFMLPRPWVQKPGADGHPPIAVWTCRDGMDEQVYRGAMVATYCCMDMWPLLSMDTLVPHTCGPDHMPNYHED